MNVNKSSLTTGIIGGLGPVSTVDYYQNIIKSYQNTLQTKNYPHIIINSVNMTEILADIAAKKYDTVTEKLLFEIQQLKNAGADFACISANTPHIVFDQLKNDSPLPLISIVEAAAEYSKNKDFNNVLLTGTLFTMNNTFYQKTFEKEGLNCIVPEPEDRKAIQNIIFPDLEAGIITKEMKENFVSICEKIIHKEKQNGKTIDAVILGCTELPTLIHNGDLSVAVIDTTAVHVKAIVKRITN